MSEVLNEQQNKITDWQTVGVTNYTFRLTLENTSLLLLEYITVGRSEHANIFVDAPALKGCINVGLVPRVTFFSSLSSPMGKKIFVLINQVLSLKNVCCQCFSNA